MAFNKRKRDYPWLSGNDSGAYCSPCKRIYHGKCLSSNHGCFITKPFNNWKKLLIFQDITMIYLIFNLSDILQPLHILSQQLQSNTMCLAEVPDKVNATINRLKEIELDSASVTETVNTFLEKCKEHGIGLMGDNNIDVHSTIVQPYINKIIKHMIHRLQNKGINSIARVEQIFNPKNMIPDDIKYGEKDIQVVSEEVGVTNVGDVVSEWKIFRNYLKSYSCNNAMNATDILAKLASASDISYGFPLLADIACRIICAPLGTATVERSFSTMN